MEFGEGAQNHLTEELESLRRQIADLKALMREPLHAKRIQPLLSDAARREVEQIQGEIEQRLGYLPPFFLPAKASPEVFSSLWHQMKSSYLDSPMPGLTKEKLFSRLSRVCPVSYAIRYHSCSLHRLGMRSGEILAWLERPLPAGADDLEPCFSLFATVPRPVASWPEPGSLLEDALMRCAMGLFFDAAGGGRNRDELSALLGPSYFARLVMFLEYVKRYHFWLECFPEPGQEKDQVIGSHLVAMLEEEPRLPPFFREYFENCPPAHPPEETGRVFAGTEPVLPAILEEGPFGIAALDPEYRIIRSNQALCQLLGYTGRELEALGLPAVAHPQDVGGCIHLIDQVLSGARTQVRMEKRFLKRNREIVWTELTAVAVRREEGRPAHVLAFMEDITERKQAEEGLRGKKQIFERLLSDSQDGIFTFDRDMVCTLWSPSMERIFGIRELEAVGRMVFDVFPFLVESGDDRHLLETLRGEAVSVRNRLFRLPGEPAREGFYDAHFSPLHNGDEKVTGGIGFVRDITERRKAEEAQRATEERYRDLFENANDIVFTLDLEGRITSLNKAAERITGYPRSEALHMTAGQVVAPEHLPGACRLVKRQIDGESPAPYELDIICNDGRRVAVEVSTHIISREGRPVGVEGIARDVTERKKTEEALQEAKQKLEDWVHELEQRSREMTLLSDMGDMLRACLSTDEAYTVIVRVAQQIFPVQAGALYVISPARNAVEAVAVWGDAAQVERVFAPDECWALRRGRVHWVEDSSVGLLCKHLRQPPPEGYLCVPMMAQSEALGILYLTQPGSARLTEAKQRLAVAMAEHIAMALSNLRLHETLRNQSIRDPVTGLFNRQFMEESLELELRRAARSRHPLGVIIMEIDRLESMSRPLEDHAEDSILRELGNLLQTIIRKEDIACRYGAGKFAMVLPQGSLEISAQRAESLRDMIKDLDIRHRGRPVGHVTVSAGVSGYPDHGRTSESLLRAAEGALQRAKQEGGNRTLTAQ